MSDAKHSKYATSWYATSASNWQLTEVKYNYDVSLGKMLQPFPASSVDVVVPYLRAQNVQWDGVHFEDVSTMWASRQEIETLRIELDDLLVCEGGEAGRAAIVASRPPENCIIQNAIHRVRAKDTGCVRFLLYVLYYASASGWLQALASRATISHFTGDQFNELPYWQPPLALQVAISDYLDQRTQELDQLITAKRDLLILLAEKRRALITHAVTRGLDPHAPLRDSGVPWLGEIPAHWEVTYLRPLLRSIDYGISESVIFPSQSHHCRSKLRLLNS